MHCATCNQIVVTAVVNGDTVCTLCNSVLVPCPHASRAQESTMIVCMACGLVLANNDLDFSQSDPEDAVGGSGNYGEEQNRDEVEDGK
jgi:hypothetical protein